MILQMVLSISGLMNLHPTDFLWSYVGEVQKETAAELLNLHPCGFRPQHSGKLGNEFRLFTNYDPEDRLGGWEQAL